MAKPMKNKVRIDVLEDRLRRVELNLGQINSRFKTKGYREGFTGLIKEYDHLIDVAISAVDYVSNRYSDSRIELNKKRAIARIYAMVSDAIYNGNLFLRQITSPIQKKSNISYISLN